MEKKKIVIIKNNDPLLSHDYTEGKTDEIMEQLLNSGGILMNNYSDFFDYLNKFF